MSFEPFTDRKFPGIRTAALLEFVQPGRQSCVRMNRPTDTEIRAHSEGALGT